MTLLHRIIEFLARCWSSLVSFLWPSNSALHEPSGQQSYTKLQDAGSGNLLCMIRHSKRADADGHAGITPDQWPDRLTRPYDTPIADEELPRLAAAQLRAHGLARFDLVVASPFRRCLQTAGILAQELDISLLVVDNRLGEDLNAADRCWSAAGVPVGEYTYMSSTEASRWALVNAADGVRGFTQLIWRRAEHPVLQHPDNVHERVCQLPQVCNDAIRATRNTATAVLVVTHGDLLNAFAPGFDWDPSIGRYRADECGWLACRGREPLDSYEGDTVPIELIPRVLAAEGLSSM